MKCLNLNMLVNATKYSIRNGVIRWRILPFTKVVAHIFKLALTVSEILSFEMSDIANLDQGQGVQHSERSRSVTNVTSIQIIIKNFLLALIVFHFKLCDHERK